MLHRMVVIDYGTGWGTSTTLDHIVVIVSFGGGYLRFWLLGKEPALLDRSSRVAPE